MELQQNIADAAIDMQDTVESVVPENIDARVDWSSDAVRPLVLLVEGFAPLVTFSLPKSDTNFYSGSFDTKIQKYGNDDRTGTKALPRTEYVASRSCAVRLISIISMDIQD